MLETVLPHLFVWCFISNKLWLAWNKAKIPGMPTSEPGIVAITLHNIFKSICSSFMPFLWFNSSSAPCSNSLYGDAKQGLHWFEIFLNTSLTKILLLFLLSMPFKVLAQVLSLNVGLSKMAATADRAKWNTSSPGKKENQLEKQNHILTKGSPGTNQSCWSFNYLNERSR